MIQLNVLIFIVIVLRLTSTKKKGKTKDIIHKIIDMKKKKQNKTKKLPNTYQK